MRHLLVALVLVIALVMLNTARAQSADSTSAILLPEHRTELINDITETLNDVYIFPDVAAEMAGLINRKNTDGEYDQFDTVAGFADQLTEDLQSISHDRHLHVAASQAPTVDGTGGELSREEMAAIRLAQAKAGNFGFKQIEMLPG